MNWIRILKGHESDLSELKYKDGDEARFAFPAYTTDKLLVFATDGRFFTVGCDRLSRGKGHGDPIRLFIELENDDDIVDIVPYNEAAKFLVAADNGRGFIVAAQDVVASTKNGRQVLNVTGTSKALLLRAAEGENVAIIGDNRKLLIFPISEIPQMQRGQGVALQKYKDSKLSDIKVLKASEGLAWKSGERLRTEPDITPWAGHRGTAGRLPPTGFPRSNKFE